MTFSVTTDSTNNQEVVRITKDQKVGINETAPFGYLHVSTPSGDSPSIYLEQYITSTSNTLGTIAFGNRAVDGTLATIKAETDGSSHSGFLAFSTEGNPADHSNVNDLQERLRIHATCSIEINGASLKISGSSTSTGSFGKLFIGNQSLTNTGNSEVEFSQNIKLKTGFGFQSSLGFNVIQHEVDGSDSGEDLIRIGVDDSPNTDILFQTPGIAEVLLLENAGSARFYGDVRFTKANAKISGSATSTGSFGKLYIDKKIGVGTLEPG